MMFNTYSLIGQESYPMTFWITEESSRKPISGANVMIKELGYQKELSDDTNGKASFPKVPIGEIHYIISAENYTGEDGTFNITKEIKSNSLEIQLSKKPSMEESGIMKLIDGEVVDERNQDVEGAVIELRIGKIEKRDTTDFSGAFSIEINMNELQYNDQKFKLEVKKGDCMYENEFLIPENNYVFESISLYPLGLGPIKQVPYVTGITLGITFLATGLIMNAEWREDYAIYKNIRFASDPVYDDLSRNELKSRIDRNRAISIGFLAAGSTAIITSIYFYLRAKKKRLNQRTCQRPKILPILDSNGLYASNISNPLQVGFQLSF